MSTWSLTGVDITAGLAVSNILQQMGTCRPWCPVPELCHYQCPWITPAKLQVECSAGPKPSRSAWRTCL